MLNHSKNSNAKANYHGRNDVKGQTLKPHKRTNVEAQMSKPTTQWKN